MNSKPMHFEPRHDVPYDRIMQTVVELTKSLQPLQIGGNHWNGELASSVLSTATAVSALCLKKTTRAELISAGCDYILQHQNPDGGWGDTDRSQSNISTTLLAIAALTLAKRSDENASMIQFAWQYVERCGSWEGLRRRYGKDKTFAVPILTNCALAGLIDWRFVPTLPYEAAVLPQSWYRFIRLPVVSYAIPALVAIGQVREHFRPLKNPLRWPLRQLAIKPTLQVLQAMQPASGGYLEAVPLTSFVLMSLAAKGLADHPVAVAAERYLWSSVRADGSWPIDTNLATWGTSLTIAACLQFPKSIACREGIGRVSDVGSDQVGSMSRQSETPADLIDQRVIDWLMSCQHRERHAFTGAAPGGWGWSDLSGAVPDADDTPGALLALAYWLNTGRAAEADQIKIADAGALGIRWLLDLQNRDGGWPTFCRGWGALPFDRSGSDLTAHAIRALYAWSELQQQGNCDWSTNSAVGQRALAEIPAALQRGWRYLERQQLTDGSWLPLWFGNQDETDEINPIYGTARVLVALAACRRIETSAARAAIDFILQRQNPDGGWGGGQSVRYACNDGGLTSGVTSTLEETSQAVEALAACGLAHTAAVQRGTQWICNAVAQGWHHQPQPIGFYFAKLWYYERMYPIVYALAALGRVRSTFDN